MLNLSNYDNREFAMGGYMEEDSHKVMDLWCFARSRRAECNSPSIHPDGGHIPIGEEQKTGELFVNEGNKYLLYHVMLNMPTAY